MFRVSEASPYKPDADAVLVQVRTLLPPALPYGLPTRTSETPRIFVRKVVCFQRTHLLLISRGTFFFFPFSLAPDHQAKAPTRANNSRASRGNFGAAAAAEAVHARPDAWTTPRTSGAVTLRPSFRYTGSAMPPASLGTLCINQ